MTKKRVDLYLLEQGKAFSRTQAQDLIEAQQVFLVEGDRKQLIKKPSQTLSVDQLSKIQVIDGPANRYVSRGGLKLEGALAHLGFSVQDFHVLDVGISTGGFTDCLLQSGAASVVGVDVGHGQVSEKLIKDNRLTVVEGVNARDLSKNSQMQKIISPQSKDLAVMDVSFISIALIIPELSHFIKTEGHLLSLVKPQFEVGIDGLAKGGIVKDVSLFAEVEKKVRLVCQESGFTVLDYFASSIQGKDGNHEFFVFAQKN